MVTCFRNKYYIGAIICDCFNDVQNFTETLIEEQSKRTLFGIDKIIYEPPDKGIIEFENSSKIYILTSKSKFLGYKFNEILYASADTLGFAEDMTGILIPYKQLKKSIILERLNKNINKHTHKDTESEDIELQEFLNTFRTSKGGVNN